MRNYRAIKRIALFSSFVFVLLMFSLVTSTAHADPSIDGGNGGSACTADPSWFPNSRTAEPDNEQG